MNPFELLTEEDLITIREYIESYSVAYPTDMEKILSSWNKNKRTLCKALGGKLRVSIPISLKRETIMFSQSLQQVYKPFYIEYAKNYSHFYGQENHLFISALKEYLSLKDIRSCMCGSDIYKIEKLFSYNTIMNGKVRGSFIIDKNVFHQAKDLKISEGTKIIKAIQKFCNYSRFFEEDANNKSLFEDWKNQISDIYTRTTINANLVFSIHPIDYITMSDNNCGWTSCMGWNDKGSYNSGTLEMMNSRMAIVCYLESSKDFIFNSHKIPNKSWRALLFANKDIAVVGKPYPYYNENIAYEILKFYMKLVKANLHWSYKYQFEEYYDNNIFHTNPQIRCNSYYDIVRKDRRKNKKHILLYTYGMYNDIVKDKDTFYWCCRNDVKKTKRLSVSGLATCLCCGKPMDSHYDLHDNWTDDFTGHSTRKVCWNCEKEYGCYYCDKVSQKNAFKIKILTCYYTPWRAEGQCEFPIREITICADCLQDRYYYNSNLKVFIRRDEINYIRSHINELYPKDEENTDILNKIINNRYNDNIRLMEENFEQYCSKYKVSDSF